MTAVYPRPLPSAAGSRSSPHAAADILSDNQSTSQTQVAHTLTACTRCRQRKTRCDPQLPRCGPCERTNSICEYYDANKGHNVNRNYVVFLQHRVRELERELECVENEDIAEDPEAMMRPVAVRVHDAVESKYLGPSSGIAITRLVMQLAKQFTDSKSIKDIVPEQRSQQLKELHNQEQAKPTSKIYPLISDVAAPELPNRPLTDLLVQVYKLKVQPMYPALHEPTLDIDIDTVYLNPEKATSSQNFICRMVIAISLQKMDTNYAGLADSYYLAALQYLEAVTQPMNLQTLQAFALMAEYSLLTPTRTAIYYIMGMAVRLLQALGFHEEKTITRGRGDATIDALEIDMRRRLYWCIMVMDLGLAHSLGRPAMLATDQEHIDVGWFETCDDHYITTAGIDPMAPPVLKKWVTIHFFKMRLLQLEIRRKLYLKKRPEPKDDSHEWFTQMEAKLIAWRDASPEADEGHGIDKVWFTGRYNTMVVFLYRPSPQVPRPSLDAALKCFEACQYNIYMHREQINNKNVDLTWIFTQAIFMAVNTILWTLSYDEVRRRYSRALVEKDLEIALDSIALASERWPGVASACQLYEKLIAAILKIYEKDGDIPISASTPSDAPSPNNTFSDPLNRSSTTSPATASSVSISTPPDAPPPFGYLHHAGRRSIEQSSFAPYPTEQAPSYPKSAFQPQQTPPLLYAQARIPSESGMNGLQSSYQTPNTGFDPSVPFNPLPEWTTELTIPSWSGPPGQQMHHTVGPMGHSQSGFDGISHNLYDANPTGYPFPNGNEFGPVYHEPTNGQYWNMDAGIFGNGLNQAQQEELMHSLETDGMEDIQSMISNTLAALAAKAPIQRTI